MRDTGKVAIARVVLRSRERLVVVRPYQDALLMATMMFGDEVHAASELSELEEPVEISEREFEVARQLVGSLAERFDVSKYRDTYREAVLDLIDRKASGEEIVTQPAKHDEPQATPDLLSALEASLADARSHVETNGGGRSNGRGRSRSSANKAAAKSASTAKPRRKVSAGKATRRGDTHDQRRH